MDTSEKSLIRRIEADKPLLYFAIVFIGAFLVLAFAGTTIMQPIKAVYKSMGSAVGTSLITKKTDRQHIAEVIDDPQSANSLRLNVQYHEKASSDGIVPVKYTVIDIYREAYIPLVFTLSLIIATPIPMRRRAIALVYGFLIAQFYICLKFFILSFDNYRAPEFAAAKFPGLIDFMIYMSSKFFATTGFSSSVIFPLLFWILSSFRSTEIAALRDWFVSNTQTVRK